LSPRGGSPKGRVVPGPSATQRERRGAGPVTTKGHQRRTKILAAAHDVFEELGFVETRVADIVAAADVAQGTFYTYFDSKDAVFAEVAQNVIDDMLAHLHAPRRAGASPHERVREGLQRFIDAFRPHAVIIGLIEQVGTFTPEMRKLRLALRESFVALSARGIARMQVEGHADPDLDPLMTAEVLGAMVDQTCYIWFSLGKDFQEIEVLDSLSMIWSRAIGLREDTGAVGGA
jgi:AcrR family transcriptional regulator